jgi:hypothetical protein
MLRFRRDRGMERLIPRRAAAVWWQSMPELSLGSSTFRCRFIRKGFNSIPQVVRSSSISPSQYDRSCGSPIRKAGVNLVHHDRRRQFPNGAPSRRGTDPHRFPQPREARRVLDQRRCARVQPGRRTFQLKPHSFRPRCDPQARERLTRPLEARPDFTFCAGGDWAAWLES